MGSALKEDLLDFALSLYSVDAVKESCLALQDSYNASVNIVLWLCWLDARQICVDSSALMNAQDIVGGVNQELLEYLREARGQLLEASSFTRVQDKLIGKHILSAELAIEKILLQRLQDLTSRLERAEEEDEPLSLFDYLNHLEVHESGTLAAELLDHSRNYVVIQRELA